jgi:hypothetical protein
MVPWLILFWSVDGTLAPVDHEDMKMGMEVEQLAGGLEETHCAGCHLSAVEGDDIPNDGGDLQLHRFKFAVFE